MNNTNKARIAALDSLTGAIHSAVSVSQTEYTSENKTGAATITLNGQSITTVNDGYPTASATGIGKALQTLSGFTPTYADGTTTTFEFTTPVENCFLTYTAATGAVAPTTSGC